MGDNIYLLYANSVDSMLIVAFHCWAFAENRLMFIHRLASARSRCTLIGYDEVYEEHGHRRTQVQRMMRTLSNLPFST
jgi:hypothetical protein